MRKHDMIITGAAVFISFCAFFVSIYQTTVLKKQTDIMNEQKEAAVWPRLFTARNTGPNVLQFTLQNDGVGPALIKYIEVTMDGSPYASWSDMFYVLNDSCEARASISMINNRVIKAGESVILCSLMDEDFINSFYKKRPKIGIDIYYESVYGRLWRLHQVPSKKFAVPKLVDSYPVNSDREFMN